jgi:cyclophilin family peptidyl-prolyl cis-trans isomerase
MAEESSSDDEPIMEEEEFVPNNPVATFTVSGAVNGSFSAEIYLNRVPRTASNFIDLVQRGFYVGLHFHRVVPDFMIHTGCPMSVDPHHTDAGTAGPPDVPFRNLVTKEAEKRFTTGESTGNIEDEFVSKDSNVQGTLCVANYGQKDTGGSQFLINMVDNPLFDWFDDRHPAAQPVFGHIITGWDVCEAISRVKTAKPPPARHLWDEEKVEMFGAEANPVDPVRLVSITMSGMPVED